MGLLSAAVGLLGGLGSRSARRAQKRLASEQAELIKAQREMYQKVGVPAYMTALRGLMASYGYRPAETGVAGTSLGQPPGGGEADQYGFDWGAGTWGYYPQVGRELGAVADVYDRAKQNILDVARTQGLPSATVLAALERIERQRAIDTQNLMIEAQRAGPLALLSALGPALGSAQPAMAGAESLMQYYGTEQAGTMAALGQLAKAIEYERQRRRERLTPNVPTTPVGVTAPTGVTTPIALGSGMPGGAVSDQEMWSTLRQRWPLLGPFLEQRKMYPEARALLGF